MTYCLGIDLGTTYTAAAICRQGRNKPETQVIPLSSRSPAIPSVLFLPGDRSVVVGEGAERRAVTDADRVVREFKRRIGDDIPLLVGGRRYPAHYLAATVVHWVWERVVEREGERPERVAVTCPAGWGPYKRELFARAVRETHIGDVTMLTEPQAAAINYASRERVEPGALLAAYDLGGGTFDTAVLRKDSPAGFAILGRPEGIEGLGGVTFDDAIFEHVCAAAGVPLTEMDPADPDVLFEATRLRRECTEAKEALSVDTEATIPVALGGVRQRVRLTRAEFEELIRPDLDRTIEALHRAIGSADTRGRRPDAILLIGGSSRIPLVSQLISAEFGQAPAIDADPKVAVAEGAARFLMPPAPDAARDTAPNTAATRKLSQTLVALPVVPPQRPPVATMLDSDDDDGDEDQPRQRRRSRQVKLGAAGVLLLLAGIFIALSPSLASLDKSSPPSRPTSNNAAGHSTGRPAPSTTKPDPRRSANLVGDNPGATASTSAPATTRPRTGKSGTPKPTATPRTTPTTPRPTGSTTSPTPTPTPTPTTSPTPTPTPTTSATGSP